MLLLANRSLKLIFDKGLTWDLRQIKKEGAPKTEGHFYNKMFFIPIFLLIKTRIFHL